MKTKHPSMFELLLVLTALLALLTFGALTPEVAFAATPSTATFDFDTGLPALSESQSMPFNQTSNEITATFSSVSGAAFSVQSDRTTFLTLSQFSGKYLYPSNVFRNSLTIQFNQSLTNISLTFATIEFHGGPGIEPSNITLTAFMGSTGNPPVGVAIARGTWPINDSYPMGNLTFSSGNQGFNLVMIELPYQGPTTPTGFMVDNVTVTATNVIPEFPPSIILSFFMLATTITILFAKRKLHNTYR